jgi:hypothetical protein
MTARRPPRPSTTSAKTLSAPSARQLTPVSSPAGRAPRTRAISFPAWRSISFDSPRCPVTPTVGMASACPFRRRWGRGRTAGRPGGGRLAGEAVGDRPARHPGVADLACGGRVRHEHHVAGQHRRQRVRGEFEQRLALPAGGVVGPVALGVGERPQPAQRPAGLERRVGELGDLGSPPAAAPPAPRSPDAPGSPSARPGRTARTARPATVPAAPATPAAPRRTDAPPTRASSAPRVADPPATPMSH